MKFLNTNLPFQTSIVNECLTEEEQKTLYKLMTKLQKHTENKIRKIKNPITCGKCYAINFFNYHLTSKLKMEE